MDVAMLRMGRGVLCATLAGCGPTLLGDDTDGALDSSSSSTAASMSVGPDPTLTTVGPTTTITTTPTTTIDPTGDPMCPTFDLGSSVPNSVSSVLDDEVDQFSGSCGGAAVDAVLSFTAPQDGAYTFATAGTSYDTVLYVLDGLCGGPELACNDDTLDLSSEVTVTLFAGQVVTVVIDGFDEIVAGAWHIDVDFSSAQCPDEELGDALPISISASTQGAGDLFSPSCMPEDGQERRFLWTAPHTGVFTFDNDASIFSAVYLLADACDGAQLACDAGQLEPVSGVSGVVASLVGGQTTTVVVDALFGDSGPVTLNIAELDGVCPSGDLGSDAPLQIFDDTFAYANSGGRSCGGWFAPDATYTWTAPAAGTYRFEVIDSGFAHVLAVQDGVCGGGELGCVDAFTGFGTPIVLDLAAGQLMVIAVDGLGHQGGPFELLIAPDTCPELDLGSDVPVVVDGALFEASPTSEASCAPTSGPDLGYRFVAPAGGVYQFDTIGSSFDTVLSVRADGCGGPELACDDDLGGELSSLVQVELSAGDTVVVTVDGFDGDQGEYVLRAQLI